MNHLDPNWLASFAAIARAGSVSKAAQQVHLTSSAVSQHLRQLESALGVRLVERTTRSLKLSADGERFLPYANQLLDLQIAARASVSPQIEQQVWRIGISEYFMPQNLSALLHWLETEAKGARLELLWASSAHLRHLWDDGQMDLAVITASDAPDDARLIRREPLAWVGAPNRIPPKDRPTQLVLLGTECPVRQIATAALARTGRAYHLRLSCSGCQAAIAALRAGWGVGCLNTSAIPEDLWDLSRVDAKRWASPGRLSFYALSRPSLSRMAKRLADWAH